MTTTTDVRTTRRASALLAVFWILAILSFAVVTTLAIVVTGIETESTRKLTFNARQLAEKGIAIAANPLVDRHDSLLHFENEFAESYDVRIQSEAVRIHLNASLISGDQAGLRRLFSVGWGLTTGEADALLAAMLDWIDSDDQTQRLGAERRDYSAAGFPALPLNRPFRSLEEVALVRGMKEVSSRYPDWRQDLTLWSLSGKLDVNEADARLISLISGCSREAADQFVRNRNGDDGVPGSGDDRIVGSVVEVISQLGLPDSVKNQLEDRITFDEPAVRIQSLGVVGDVRLIREVVMQRSQSQPFLYHLNERVLP